MAVPAVSTLLRFEPSTLYRFVCGLVGVVAVIGFLPGVHTGTPLEALDHVADWWAGSSSWTWPLRAHHWIADRSTQLGPIASVAMFVGVFAARGNDRSPDQWRGSSTALAGWALAVEAGAGGSGLGALLIASAVGIAISRPFAERTPLGELLADTLYALFIATLYAASPLIWMISRPSPGDEPADARVGA